MTLSAITQEFNIFNPSAMIESGEDRQMVVITMRKQQNRGLYCPHCYLRTGEKTPVRFRNSEDKRPHFFHLQNIEGSRECTNFQGETEKHLMAKAAIAESLKAMQGVIDMPIDARYMTSPGVTFRKPDIWVTYPNSATEVHEIQISYINSDELIQRTNDLRSHGANRVNWYLYGKNYNNENRSALLSAGIPCWRLWFENNGATVRWKKDGGIKEYEKPEQSKKSPKDSCKGVAESLEPVFESCYLPFQIGDRVHLRVIPSRQYQVEQVWAAVDLGDSSSHLRPGSESAVNHLYQLRRNEQKAYWYHSQLSFVEGKCS